jgi:N-acetylmuramoyl-L-alanine amidase
MRTILRLFQVLLAVTILAAVMDRAALRAATFNGQYYVPLSDFAHSYGFSLDNEGREAILTSKSMRLVFDVNSAQAQINGLNVRLSYPVAGEHGGLLVSQLDIETTIHPLIFPVRSSGRRITTICLDPGHGGKDSGNHVGGGLFGHSEKIYTLALAMDLREQLEAAGFHVILTRSRDVYVDLPARPATANHNGADLFISLHFNASPVDQGEIEGPETYCITPIGAPSSNAHGETGEFGSAVGAGPTAANRNGDKSLLLAYQMEKSLVQNLHANDRGVKHARFAVLRDAAMPAILIEGGFMTHPVESKKIYSAAYRQQMAAAIVKGVLAYQRVIAPPALHSAPEPHKVYAK